MALRTFSPLLLGFGALAALAAGCDTNVGTGQVEIGCVEREDLEPYWVTFEADGLHGFEGMRAVVLTEMGLAFEAGQACATRASVEVVDGGFALTLEGRSDGAAYPLVGVFIDRNADDRCDGEVDPAWHQIVAVGPGGTLLVSVNADTLAPYPADERCEPFE
jgi:hypothetical protein